MVHPCCAEDRIITEFLFDAEELVVFADAVGAAERTCFDLARVGRNGDVRDGRIFRFTGAVADDGGVFVDFCQFDGIQSFG